MAAPLSPLQKESAPVEPNQLRPFSFTRVLGSVADGFRMLALQFSDLVSGNGAKVTYALIYPSPSIPDFTATTPPDAKRPCPVSAKSGSPHSPYSPCIKV